MKCHAAVGRWYLDEAIEHALKHNLTLERRGSVRAELKQGSGEQLIPEDVNLYIAVAALILLVLYAVLAFIDWYAGCRTRRNLLIPNYFINISKYLLVLVLVIPLG